MKRQRNLQALKRLFRFFQVKFITFKRQDHGISWGSIKLLNEMLPLRVTSLLVSLILEYGPNQIASVMKDSVHHPKSGRELVRVAKTSLVTISLLELELTTQIPLGTRRVTELIRHPQQPETM
ncbi:hypothetical protein Godav_010719 [Gossypium davidsonii]|uniref:Uncharacterized protein n=2 Tax=Gossypium TaxID=3633 RepID=A0A7J8R894_GOSDV|nr:hypothetical protein [Gossypium davidsonii]MBA0673521.1 hypothetical protein [Gossypium klotzschianum]